MTPTWNGRLNPSDERCGVWSTGERGGASSVDMGCSAGEGADDAAGVGSTQTASMRLSSARAARERARAARKIRVMTVLRHGPEGWAQVPHLRVGTHICKKRRAGERAGPRRREKRGPAVPGPMQFSRENASFGSVERRSEALSIRADIR